MKRKALLLSLLLTIGLAPAKSDQPKSSAKAALNTWPSKTEQIKSQTKTEPNKPRSESKRSKSTTRSEQNNSAAKPEQNKPPTDGLILPAKTPEYETLREQALRKIRFCDELQLRSNCEFPVSAWSIEDKQIVTEAIETACLIAPGLAKRAIAYAPLAVYRCRQPMRRIGQAYPIFVDGRCNELMLANGFFDDRKIEVFFKQYSNRIWAIVHELSHLADTGHKTSGSAQWLKLLPKILSGQSLALRLGEGSDSVCWSMGVPSKYAGTNEREALAECSTALVMVRNIPAMDAELIEYVKKNLLSYDFKIDPSIELSYEGWSIINQKRNSETDLAKALEKFKKALEIDPSYVSADWGRKFVEMRIDSASKKTAP